MLWPEINLNRHFPCIYIFVIRYYLEHSSSSSSLKQKNKVGGLVFVFRCCWDDVNHARPHLSVSALINQLWHSLRSPAACTQLHIVPTNGKNKDESLDETERSRKWRSVQPTHKKNMSGPGLEQQQQQHIAESAAQKWKDPPHTSQPYQDIYTCKFFRYVFTRGFPFQMSLFKQPTFFSFCFSHFFRRKKENKSLWSGTRPCSWWWHGRSRTECDSFSRQPNTSQRNRGVSTT